MRKLKTSEIAAVAGLVIFTFVLLLPSFLPKNGCEVARPGYKCASIEDVLKENCVYWEKYACLKDCRYGSKNECEKAGCYWEPDRFICAADPSLPQVTWYIKNLCELYNQKHGTDYGCATPETACAIVLGREVCGGGQ
ncbi:MAG: hypothetical protein GXO63_02155 [Candidatus Micrarchaeota archaeon]|nr:hypothetical protein [Candidatus Micrarchaeota archaeon]